MKLSPFLTIAAGVGAAILSFEAPAQHTVIAVGAPAGPGWYSYGDHSFRRGWGGPRYYGGAGEHHGWYNWNGSYYRNCSYRWVRHHTRRDWRCW